VWCWEENADENGKRGRRRSRVTERGRRRRVMRMTGRTKTTTKKKKDRGGRRRNGIGGRINRKMRCRGKRSKRMKFTRGWMKKRRNCNRVRHKKNKI
jgi:hypothetical protein